MITASPLLPRLMIFLVLAPEVLQYVGSSEKTEALAIAANSKSDGGVGWGVFQLFPWQSRSHSDIMSLIMDGLLLPCVAKISSVSCLLFALCARVLFQNLCLWLVNSSSSKFLMSLSLFLCSFFCLMPGSCKDCRTVEWSWAKTTPWVGGGGEKAWMPLWNA